MAPWLHNSAALLRQARVFASRDREVAQHEIARALNRHGMRWGRGEVDTALHLCRLEDVSLCLLRYGAEVEIEPEFPQSFYLLQIPVSGRARIHSRDGTLQVGDGTGAVISPTVHARLDWDRGCEQLLVKLPVQRVTEVLGGLVDRPFGGTPEFGTTFSAGGDADWLRVLEPVLGELRGLESGSQGTLAGRSYARHLEELLLMRMLLSQPHSHSDLLARPAVERMPRRIREAQDYALARLEEPITTLDMARAAGVGVRSLTQSFRDHCDTTPMAWLRARRLEAARRELVDPRPGTRVADVALRWGFPHLGRFAALYRARFGESPRRTLER